MSSSFVLIANKTEWLTYHIKCIYEFSTLYYNKKIRMASLNFFCHLTLVPLSIHEKFIQSISDFSLGQPLY